MHFLREKLSFSTFSKQEIVLDDASTDGDQTMAVFERDIIQCQQKTELQWRRNLWSEALISFDKHSTKNLF